MSHLVSFALLRVGIVVMALAAAVTARAQNDCILDNCADRKPLPQATAPAQQSAGGGWSKTDASSAGANAGRAFDFYVLALSWSAGFCENVGGERDQCEPGRGLGFVVHGLWPQYERGFPQDCATSAYPNRVALDKANGLFPDERLARYEWRKHGACTGLSPQDYFAAVARARASVSTPPAFAKPANDRTLSPLDVERAFYDANPRLRPGMMAVDCRRGVMEGVRICLTKDLREFRACPEIVRRACHATRVSVPAPL